MTEHPLITLGGRDFPVPLLAVRQNRVIDPLILSLLPIFSEWTTNKGAALAKIGRQEYDSLLEIAYTATTRAQPEFKRSEFEELPVTLPELIAAFSVIAKQTGIFKRGEPGEAEAAAGPRESQTGTK